MSTLVQELEVRIAVRQPAALGEWFVRHRMKGASTK
jgi:hypothetical protein